MLLDGRGLVTKRRPLTPKKKRRPGLSLTEVHLGLAEKKRKRGEAGVRFTKTKKKGKSAEKEKGGGRGRHPTNYG